MPYEIKDGKLIMDDVTCEYTINGKTMTLVKDGQVMILKRR